MKLRARIIKALMKKDFRMLAGNKNTFFILLLPILFCVLYTKVLPIGKETGMLYPLLLCEVLNLICAPISLLSMMVAEEKEKNTLRTLIMSDVRAMEFLASKMFVVLLLMEVISVANYLLVGLDMKFFAGYMLISTLASVGILFLGAAVGILSENQMSTGTISTPLMLLLMLPTMFAGMNKVLEKIAFCLPTNAFMEIMNGEYQNKAAFLSGANMKHYAVCLVWIVIGIAVFNIVYKKRGVDSQ